MSKQRKRASSKSKPAAQEEASGNRVVRRAVRARYDAAQLTPENKNHWAMSDGLSADAAASPGVRRVLRNRARYEVANNTYASAMVDLIAIDCIGTGPRLQMNSALGDTLAQQIEDMFGEWAQAIGLAEKLRTMRATRVVDGEAFGMLTNNPEIPTPVQLDIRLLEAEQVASTQLALLDTNQVDGIRFDGFGNPIEYDVLKVHPGGMGFGLSGESDKIPAAQMVHFFIAKRPGQRRGVPGLTPALPLFAQLRRWTLSVLAAAETASDFAALLYTDMPPDGEAAPSKPFESLEIERRMMTTIPAGWKMGQFKAEQPVSTYKEFKLAILDEIARAELVPANLLRGNSSEFNFSSAKLDGTPYKRVVEVDRQRIQTQVLDRIFYAWKREAVLIEGYLPQTLRTISANWSHSWVWPSVETGNPKDEADCASQRIANGTSTQAAEAAALGRDWQEINEQQEREMKDRKARGLPDPNAIPVAVAAPAAADPNAKPATKGKKPANPDDALPANEDDLAAHADRKIRLMRDANGAVLGFE